ncbi:MAG: prepilin peptidase, partial [Clostridia bacterium]|nr:prepilin peptidase [Clostridia bacterium]
MNIFFYIIIFIMGITFGSFYTLAVYRIPKGQDITHTHSYCPNCGNKLGFFELIPVLSYLWLGGKCKHC